MRGLKIFLIFLGVALCATKTIGQSFSESTLAQVVMSQNEDGFWEFRPAIQKAENPRLVAIALDVTLGLFGMHRLYLGTDIKVPIAYTLTFGGGAIVWIVDLVLLVASPNIESFKNNPHFFMWIPPANKAK